MKGMEGAAPASTEMIDLFMRIIYQGVRNEKKSTLSDADRLYAFHSFPDGCYTVSVEHPDFALSETEETVVMSGLQYSCADNQ